MARAFMPPPAPAIPQASVRPLVSIHPARRTVVNTMIHPASRPARSTVLTTMPKPIAPVAIPSLEEACPGGHCAIPDAATACPGGHCGIPDPVEALGTQFNLSGK